MKNVMVVASIMIICTFSAFAIAADSGKPVIDAVALGNIGLSFVDNVNQRTYLGLSTHSAPSLGQVAAERVILIIFNSFCTICQADARVMNAFYQMIEDDPDLKGRTKMIGIGAGNTPMEVEEFRKTYEVPFPLIPDPNFAVNTAVKSNLRIPMVVTAKIRKGRTLEVLNTHLGEAKSMDDLLGIPVRSSRLGPEAVPSYQ